MKCVQVIFISFNCQASSVSQVGIIGKVICQRMARTEASISELNCKMRRKNYRVRHIISQQEDEDALSKFPTMPQRCQKEQRKEK